MNCYIDTICGAQMAHLIELKTSNLRVAGSSPTLVIGRAIVK